jgi:pantoate kinase
MSVEQRINEYLVQILVRLGQMDLDQLEREVIMLEEESTDSPIESETVQIIESQVRKLVDALLRDPNGGKNKRDAIPCSNRSRQERQG